MRKFRFILFSASVFFLSCGQRRLENQKEEPRAQKTDSIVYSRLDDTTRTRVKELITYNSASEGELKTLPHFLLTHIPAGYEPLDTASADLNLDGLRDYFLAIRKIGEDTLYPSPARNLKMLLCRSGNSYDLACNTWTILAKRDEGGFSDPYPGIVAKDGEFVVQFSGGSNWKGTNTKRFTYSAREKDWQLVEEISESYFMDKMHYESDTLTVMQLGKVFYKKNYCR